MSDDNFISRWSRRKIAVRTGKPVEAEPVEAKPVIPVETGVPQEAEAPELPPLESLTPESDFSPFMKAEVDPATRRQALKTLFSDPRHNVMDGLDVYIDDYSKPDPLPADWLAKMNVMKHLGHMVEEPKEGEGQAPGEPDSALQKPMQEQPVADAASDTGNADSNAVSVTESAKSGGTLPRNEA